LRYQADETYREGQFETRPWGWLEVGAATIRAELGKDSLYLAAPLSDCMQLNPLESAARWVWFIVKEEGQDSNSFICDLGGVEKRVTFVVNLFLNCKFGPDTYISVLTRRLFPWTRQGDWRRKHLITGRERSRKRGSEIMSKDDKDLNSEITDQTTPDESHHDIDQQESSSIAKVEPPSKRTKVTERISSARGPPPGETVVKFEERAGTRNADTFPMPQTMSNSSTITMTQPPVLTRSPELVTPNPYSSVADLMQRDFPSPVLPQGTYDAPRTFKAMTVKWSEANNTKLTVPMTQEYTNSILPSDQNPSTARTPSDLRERREDSSGSLSTEMSSSEERQTNFR
jgi:hypothetical protein